MLSPTTARTIPTWPCLPYCPPALKIIRSSIAGENFKAGISFAESIRGKLLYLLNFRTKATQLDRYDGIVAISCPFSAITGVSMAKDGVSIVSGVSVAISYIISGKLKITGGGGTPAGGGPNRIIPRAAIVALNI